MVKPKISQIFNDMLDLVLAEKLIHGFLRQLDSNNLMALRSQPFKSYFRIIPRMDLNAK